MTAQKELPPAIGLEPDRKQRACEARCRRTADTLLTVEVFDGFGSVELRQDHASCASQAPTRAYWWLHHSCRDMRPVVT